MIRSGVLYGTATLAPVVVTLAVTPAVTRGLGADEYADVARALAVMQVGQIPLTLGVPAALTRLVVEVGRAAASTVTLLAVGVSLLLTALVAATLFAVGMYSDINVSTTMLLAVVCAGMLASQAQIQSFAVGSEEPSRFLLNAFRFSLLGACVGLLLATAVAATAQSYVTGMLIGQIVAVLYAIRTASGSFPRSAINQLRSSVLLGLPTIPHQLSSMAVAPLLVLSSGLIAGEAKFAGELQLSLLLGSAGSMVVLSLNNQWAVQAYKKPPAERVVYLRDTLALMWGITAVVQAIVGLCIPAMAYLLGGGDMDWRGMVTSAVICSAAVPFLSIYLANVHELFAQGRTKALAIFTPCSAAAAAALTLASTAQVPSQAHVTLALGPCLFGAFQAAWTCLARRRLGAEGLRSLRWLLAGVLMVALTVLSVVYVQDAIASALCVAGAYAVVALGLGVRFRRKLHAVIRG